MNWRICWAPLIALLAAQAVHARPVSFEEALRLAQTEQPALLARELQVKARRDSAEAADELPDPRLSAGLVNLPINGPVAFELDRQLPTQIAVGIEQDIPNLAKRRARRSLADADTEIANARLAHAQHGAAIGAGEAWVALWYAQQRTMLAEAGLAELRGMIAPAAAWP